VIFQRVLYLKVEAIFKHLKKKKKQTYLLYCVYLIEVFKTCISHFMIFKLKFKIALTIHIIHDS